jgi:type II secretory pathway component PulF
MARFGYIALRSDGRPVHGQLDAADERAAAAMLQEQSLFITKLRAAARPRVRAVGAQRLAFFFRELALMTRSGVTLLAALRVCEERGASAPTSSMAGRLAERIRAGHSLSRALAAETRIPRLAVRLVESGETTGDLDPALDRIAEIIEHRAALRRSLITSIAYPAVVFCVSLAVAGSARTASRWWRSCCSRWDWSSRCTTRSASARRSIVPRCASRSSGGCGRLRRSASSPGRSAHCFAAV